jgi:hypothetical protein
MCSSVHDRAFIIKRLGVMASHLNLTGGGVYIHVKRAEGCSYCFVLSHSRDRVEIVVGNSTDSPSRTH